MMRLTGPVLLMGLSMAACQEKELELEDVHDATAGYSIQMPKGSTHSAAPASGGVVAVDYQTVIPKKGATADSILANGVRVGAAGAMPMPKSLEDAVKGIPPVTGAEVAEKTALGAQDFEVVVNLKNAKSEVAAVQVWVWRVGAHKVGTANCVEKPRIPRCSRRSAPRSGSIRPCRGGRAARVSSGARVPPRRATAAAEASGESSSSRAAW